jgi:histidinol dehydrogenase
VLARIDLRGKVLARWSAAELAAMLPRAALDVTAAAEAVRPICEDVRTRGAAAVREYTARFDGVELDATRVPAAALTSALAELDPGVRAALTEAARRAKMVHRA